MATYRIFTQTKNGKGVNKLLVQFNRTFLMEAYETLHLRLLNETESRIFYSKFHLKQHEKYQVVGEDFSICRNGDVLRGVEVKIYKQTDLMILLKQIIESSSLQFISNSDRFRRLFRYIPTEKEFTVYKEVMDSLTLSSLEDGNLDYDFFILKSLCCSQEKVGNLNNKFATPIMLLNDSLPSINNQSIKMVKQSIFDSLPSDKDIEKYQIN